MLNINLQNVKDLIMTDKEITNLLPEFKMFFDTWKFSVRYPTFKSLGEKALMDFLLALKLEHIKILEQYFNDSISIHAMDYRMVRNRTFQLDSFEKDDLQLAGFPYLSIYRDSSKVYITNWR